MLEFIFLWGIMGAVVAAIANSKNRNPLLWFAYGFLIWPIALVHILVSKSTAEGTRQACPSCAELILPQAKICPHCRSEVAPLAPAGMSNSGDPA